MASELQKGLQVAGRYRLDRMLGEGGMGEVWAATHQVTKKPVALKFLRGSDASRADLRRRFLREARAASAVAHPNVVQIHDIFQLDDGAPVMVMDLLSGESLGSRLRREKRLTPKDVAAILLPVVSAVGTAHAMGIVHRDLKPDNIFLSDMGVRVLDFGIAKLTAAEGDAAYTQALTETGELLGTPHYMAPEQAAGESGIDHRADIWALGVILYECLAGVRPISGANLGQVLKQIITGRIVPLATVAPELPDDLVGLAASMLALEREQRLSDLRAAQAVLAHYSNLTVPSFAEARTPEPRTPTPTVPGKKSAQEESVATDPTLSLEGRARPATPAPRSRLRWWMAGGLALATAGGGAAWRLTRTAPPLRVAPLVAPVQPMVVAPSPVAEPPVAALTPSPVAAPAPPVAAPVSAKPHRHHKQIVETPPPVAPPVKEEGAKRLPGGVPEKPPY